MLFIFRFVSVLTSQMGSETPVCRYAQIYTHHVMLTDVILFGLILMDNGNYNLRQGMILHIGSPRMPISRVRKGWEVLWGIPAFSIQFL